MWGLVLAALGLGGLVGYLGGVYQEMRRYRAYGARLSTLVERSDDLAPLRPEDICVSSQDVNWSRVSSRILCWLGFWRDHLPVEAVRQLQDTLTHEDRLSVQMLHTETRLRALADELASTLRSEWEQPMGPDR